MSGKENAYNPDLITIDCMYVLLRDSTTGMLRCSYEPMGIEPSVQSELERLASTIQTKGAEIVESLIADLKRVYPERNGTWRRRPIDKSDELRSALYPVMADTGLIESVVKRLRMPLTPSKVTVLPADGRQIDPICWLFMPPYDSWGFDIPPVEQIILASKDNQVETFRNAASRLFNARRLIDRAREGYRSLFNDYLAAIEARVPGISAYKDYCPRLQDRFVEMNFNLDPSNAQIIDDILDYYRAQKLDDSIAAISTAWEPLIM